MYWLGLPTPTNGLLHGMTLNFIDFFSNKVVTLQCRIEGGFRLLQGSANRKKMEIFLVAVNYWTEFSNIYQNIFSLLDE